MTRLAALLLVLGGIAAPASAQNIEFLPGMEWDQPPVVTPGETDRDPPSDAVVLFDGKDMSAWENGEQWPVRDGIAFAGKGYVTSKQKFGDCQVHLEWSAPSNVKGDGQGRGNSGVFLMGIYEVQILDSYDNKTYADGQATAIYKQTPPLANAMRKPGEWNTYDIYWTCPKFNSSSQLEEPAYVTVVHNGVLVQNRFALRGDTAWNHPPRYVDIGPKGPIALQDHGNPVRFRNIWVREFEPPTGQRREPMMMNHSDGTTKTLAEIAAEE
ncbi:hypothetical protein Pla108_11150 [Botrimarina colliarenosi]|uniref:3-keto-alpha-glucoside-1,2-lyase/3-keto-2-hydroxy-glucal hydratase domain-containing protein n=1 Tax=Botrimarina colliarenosi TaxID=2528001 RepID=A0A5C6AKJ2_9BACT|nr:DUF1080 domain-containing protein [Botrimarina colliarenosi]TWU00170.1 hypothetical protein Pla108_11150 [Botrimarina colliarenosi]